ncbi:hypothetical protein J2Y46_000961 [Microbacterium sp. BE35]|uniref:DarT ssDNA thymidine ADP-ribosyltransferase family protein n=1 Tax=Microbacterium sp. BE35 TaxID=2817773 RepID=UPI002865D8A0|nr:DarT ssDNA thymidine ADP-ribosyltransferase family protein [Microbacterium sp. BE35]MDR7188145.1 hypothetical protein [Microbacterium sp. BE35]
MNSVLTPAVRARERGVTELLHFTTSRGLIGILAQGKVYSRDGLNADQYLENVKVLNSPDRSRDAAWTNWVNLSISRVNASFLGISKRWHVDDGVWWACVAFDVEILDHPDVYFCTGNNVYPATKRAQGVEGFEALFADTLVWGKYGSVKHRPSSLPTNLTTDAQAEVLYPVAVDLSYARAVYVPEPELTDAVAGIVAAIADSSPVDLSTIPVACRPEVFQ